VSALCCAVLRSLMAPSALSWHRSRNYRGLPPGLGREPGVGLLVSPDAFMFGHRATVILAAARNNVPAVYSSSVFARDGGLLSYGVDQLDNFRRATTYLHRILRGAKPGDLPVQFPVKYEMIVNLKTAKALGITVPRSILMPADEVIE
jgi:putative tryptophan/tyrosine transport system substrate-binding protein